MGVAYEEYPMRTVGYSATVLTHMVMGLEIGLANGYLSLEDYNRYVSEMSEVGGRQATVIEKTLKWLDSAKRQMLRSDLIVFTD